MFNGCHLRRADLESAIELVAQCTALDGPRKDQLMAKLRRLRDSLCECPDACAGSPQRCACAEAAARVFGAVGGVAADAPR